MERVVFRFESTLERVFIVEKSIWSIFLLSFYYKNDLILQEQIMSDSVSQLSNIWTMVLEKINKSLESQSDGGRIFQSFFADSKIAEIDKDVMKIACSSNLGATIIDKKYSKLVSSTLDEITGTHFELKFVTFDEIKSKKEVAKEEPAFFKDSKLNPKYTFESFVTGPSNREAYQAAVMIANTPGQLYNPLLLHSDSGLGKTHLLHAIGNGILEKYPNYKVLYISASDFVDEYIKFATTYKEDQSLVQFFKNDVDAFLIDDIQFIIGKKKTMEMFFVVFTTLVSKGKQIVITSDQDPSKLDGLDDRLKTRFSQGLVLSIEKPDLETSKQILLSKIEAGGLDVNDFDDEVITYIAQGFSSNVRELEGALNRLIFCSISMKNTNKITMNEATAAIKTLNAAISPSKRLTEDKIIAGVADYYSLTPSQLTGKIRTSRIAMARHIAMYLDRLLLDTPFIKIGETFGGKDHATVMSGVKKVENSLKTDPDMLIAIAELKKKLS